GWAAWRTHLADQTLAGRRRLYIFRHEARSGPESGLAPRRLGLSPEPKPVAPTPHDRATDTPPPGDSHPPPPRPPPPPPRRPPPARPPPPPATPQGHHSSPTTSPTGCQARSAPERDRPVLATTLYQHTPMAKPRPRTSKSSMASHAGERMNGVNQVGPPGTQS